MLMKHLFYFLAVLIPAHSFAQQSFNTSLIEKSMYDTVSFVASSQTTAPTWKECRISTGIGFANATKKMKKTGSDFWLQLDYTLKEEFSIAFEFENSAYKQVGYFTDLPAKYPNEIDVVNNSFSLLIKYNIKTMSKLKLAFASGWSYNLRTSGYFEPPRDVTSQVWPFYVVTLGDYRIPLLTEVQYPIYKTFNLLARFRYNLNQQNGNTYTAGIGLSLKL